MLGQEEVTPMVATRWVRSWRQELYTDLGSTFRLVAHMERITTLDDGTVVHTDLGQITRSAAQVMADPRVQELQTLLTELISAWYDEDQAAKQLTDEQATLNQDA